MVTLQDCMGWDTRESCPSPTIFLRFVIYQQEAVCYRRFSEHFYFSAVSPSFQVLLFKLDGW